MKAPRTQQYRRRNTMLGELSELIAEVLTDAGLPEQAVEEAGREIAFKVHQRWKGITFTFPMRDDLARERLNAHICREYDGLNADELCRKWGVTEDYIYKVVRQGRSHGTASTKRAYAG